MEGKWVFPSAQMLRCTWGGVGVEDVCVCVWEGGGGGGWWDEQKEKAKEGLKFSSRVER